MISVLVQRNPYEKGDAEIEQRDWIPGGTVGDYLPEGIGDGAKLYRDGQPVGRDEKVQDGSTIGVSLRPGFAALGAGLLQALSVAVVSYGFQVIFGRPNDPQQPGDESSSVYSWSGQRQNGQQGSPVAIHAGRIRVGGTVIGEYVEAQAIPPRNVLYQLVSLGEGPIKSIGGITSDTVNGYPLDVADREDVGNLIFIDDERAGNYPNVKVHVRLGANEQSAIEWFDKVRIEHFVGRKLPGQETESSDTEPLYFNASNWYNSGNNALWNQYAVGYTFEDEADSAIIRIRFPRGLYETSGSGGISGAHIGIQVRYRELDAIGNQIKSGGPNGDGWVFTPPVLPLPITRRDAFEFQHEIEFFDKDTYTPPGAGEALDLGGGANGLMSSQLQGGADMAPGDVAQAFSASCWIYPTSTATLSLGQFEHVIGDLDEANDRGWSVVMEQRSTNKVFGLRYGNGTTTTSTLANDFAFYGPQLNEWQHLAVSYAPGEHLRLWLNGERIVNIGPVPALEWGDNLHLGRDPQGTTESQVAWDGLIDDFLMWSDFMPQDRLAEQIALGQGRYGTNWTETLVAWFNWESPSAGNEKSGAGWYGNAIISGGAAVTASSAGLIPEDPSGAGTPRRGRYHVEVVRTNVESTAPETSNLSEVAAFTSVLDDEHAYGGDALLALRVVADDQLSSQMPPTSAVVEGRFWPVWDGVSTSSPAISQLATRNPAWIALGILTNAQIGLGRHYGFQNVDLSEVKAWADYCDDVLADGSYALDFSASDAANDIRFESLEADPVTGIVRGAFEVILPKAVHAELPDSWTLKSLILLEGLPTPDDEPGNVISDPNGGYEVYKIEDNGTSWSVWCWWDRTSESDPWTTGDLLGADVLSVTLGSAYPDSLVRGGQRRFEFNGSFDRHEKAWDALVQVCEVGRAVPIPSGSNVRFRFAGPTQPLGIIGRGSIIPGTFEMSIGGAVDETNAYDFTFLDELRSYERGSGEIFGEEITDTSDASQVVKRSTDLFGVTHATQAERHLRYDLRARQALIRSGRFQMPLDGITVEPGDVYRLSHDVLPRGTSGRLVTGSTLTTVILDQDITFLSGKTYEIALQRIGLGFQTGTVDVATLGGAGTYEQGTVIPVTGLTELPTKNNPYIITEQGTELVIEIGSTRLNQDLTRDVEWIQYDSTIFTDL